MLKTITLKIIKKQKLLKLKRLFFLAKDNPIYFFLESLYFGLRKINIFTSNFFPAYSFSLEKLWLPLTYKCNLKCAMCGQWGEKGRSKKFSQNTLQQELPLNVLKKLISEVKIFHPRIMLVGGEPFLYKNWEKLAQFIKNQNLYLEITTSGMFLKKNYKNVFKYFDSLNISLDGPPKINDEIRGIKGSFAQVIWGLKKLVDLKIKFKKNTPHINICFTINNKNYFCLFDFAKEIEALNFPIDLLLFQHLEFAPEEIIKENQKIWENKFGFKTDFWNAVCFDTQNINPQKLFKEIKKIKKNFFKNINYILFELNFNFNNLNNFYAGEKRKINKLKQKCYAPWLEAFVYPEGNVWTCLGLPLDNINKQSFRKIWNGEKYQKLRKHLQKNNFPICLHCANHWHSL